MNPSVDARPSTKGLNTDEWGAIWKNIGICKMGEVKSYPLDADGYMFCDDWGLQDKLMINPEKWCEFWKPAYKKVYEAVHDAGLNVIQMDQQQNMGLDLLKF